MNHADAVAIVQAIHDTGSTNLFFVILLAFIASYLGWIARRLREINETLIAIRDRQAATYTDHGHGKGDLP